MKFAAVAQSNRTRQRKKNDADRMKLDRLLGGHADPKWPIDRVRLLLRHLEWLGGQMPSERMKLDRLDRDERHPVRYRLEDVIQECST